MTARASIVCGFALLLVELATPCAAQISAPAPNSDCEPRTSRAARPCEPTPETAKLELEMKASFSLEVPQQTSRQCAATMEIVYTQKDTVASVEGTIDHEDCGASAGEHRLTVNVRDANREVESLAFVHSWRRDDAEPVTFKAEYPIPRDVDLVSVRPRQLSCTCADLPAEGE
jgi:hypothetical protein